MIKCEHLGSKANNKSIIDDISFQVQKGEFFGIIGPNGSGKTTLLSLLSGLKKATQGQVTLQERLLSKLSRREIAQQVAFVSQHMDTDEHLTARQVVELGRTPHLSALTPWSKQDSAIVDEAIKKVDMEAFSNQMWQTLSGGEKQRLHFARALAQQPSILILDEPTNHLDIHHQLHLLNFARQQNLTVIAALHDLNHAAFFCDRIMMLNYGKCVAIGTPAEVLKPSLISDVFKVNAKIDHDKHNRLHLSFSL